MVTLFPTEPPVFIVIPQSAMCFLFSDYLSDFSLYCLSLVSCFGEIWWQCITEEHSVCVLDLEFVMPLESADLRLFIQLRSFLAAISLCILFLYPLHSAGTSFQNLSPAHSASWNGPTVHGCSAHFQHLRANPASLMNARQALHPWTISKVPDDLQLSDTFSSIWFGVVPPVLCSCSVIHLVSCCQLDTN